MKDPGGKSRVPLDGTQVGVLVTDLETEPKLRHKRSFPKSTDDGSSPHWTSIPGRGSSSTPRATLVQPTPYPVIYGL